MGTGMLAEDREFLELVEAIPAIPHRLTGLGGIADLPRHSSRHRPLLSMTVRTPYVTVRLSADC